MLRRYLTPIAGALKANKAAAILLWIVAAALVWSFYNVDAVRGALEHVMAVKREYGIVFSFVSTAIFGGILPSLFQVILQPAERAEAWRRMPWTTLFWGYKGVQVDLFYRLQAMLFGSDMAFGTVTCKVLVDMFIYNPVIGTLDSAIFYHWLMRPKRSAPHTFFPRGWYKSLVLPLLFSTWAIWLPAVTLIYMMPLPLQVPIQNLVLSFFSLMVLVLTAQKPQER